MKKIPTIDVHEQEKARAHQNRLTKPTGALGKLEDLVIWLAGTQSNALPASRPATTIVFASDHPVANHGVSAYPKEVTAAMVANILGGGAASSVLCKNANIPMHVWDVGVDNPYTVPPQTQNILLFSHGTKGSVGNIFEQDAMDQEAFDWAWLAGERAIDNLPANNRLVLFGEMGIGNTTPAAAICAALLNKTASEMVGAGTGVTGEALSNKIQIVEKALLRCEQHADPKDILMALSGREIVAMTAAVIRAAERKMAVLVDGFIVSASVLAACRLYPKVREWVYFAHQSAEQGHAYVLNHLHADPILDCGLRLGEGSGALTALSLLDQAVLLHNQMATFDNASVPDRDS